MVKAKHKSSLVASTWNTAMGSSNRALLGVLLQNFSTQLNLQALQFYEGEKLYDCTVLVESPTGDEKRIFRCHKLVLATASPVFEAMLLGSFQEARKEQDEPIRITNVTPACFELVLKFLYSRAAPEFSSLGQAIEVYAFAHEWQIDYLERIAAVEFENFQSDPGADLQLYEMFQYIDDKENAQGYLKKMTKQCEALLSTEEWLSASKDTVLALISADNLRVQDEGALLTGVFTWALNQKKTELIRAEVKDLLPFIRLRTLSASRLEELFGTECGQVLQPEEKEALLKSVQLDDAALAPEGFSRSSEQRRKDDSQLHSVMFEPTVRKLRVLLDDGDSSSNMETRFSMDGCESGPKATLHLLGVCLHSVDFLNPEQPVDVSYECKNRDKVLGAGVLRQNEERTAGVRLFERPVKLETDVTYVVSVRHHTRPWQVANLTHEGVNCFSAKIGQELLQVGRMGDVYGLLIKSEPSN